MKRNEAAYESTHPAAHLSVANDSRALTEKQVFKI